MNAKRTPSLDDIIQTKGASRPDTIPQRGTSNTTAPQASASPPAQAPRAAEPRSKSLTLRLSETQYQRLRVFAFNRGLSHQDVIETALMAHLDAATD